MMKGQMAFTDANNKRDIRRVVLLNHTEMQAVKDGMERLGETNVSNYIRRLIQNERLKSSRKV